MMLVRVIPFLTPLFLYKLVIATFWRKSGTDNSLLIPLNIRDRDRLRSTAEKSGLNSSNMRSSQSQRKYAIVLTSV